MNKTLLRAIQKKTESTRGASLAMALFLFLVCAILSGVVLTAGTATAGRIAKKAEADRRYYSVTSAAEYLASELGGETVTIVRTYDRTESVATPYTISGEVGNETVTAGTAVTTTTASYATGIRGTDGVSIRSVGSATSATTTDGSEPAVSSGNVFAVNSSSQSFLTARALE